MYVRIQSGVYQLLHPVRWQHKLFNLQLQRSRNSPQDWKMDMTWKLINDITSGLVVRKNSLPTPTLAEIKQVKVLKLNCAVFMHKKFWQRKILSNWHSIRFDKLNVGKNQKIIGVLLMALKYNQFVKIFFCTVHM